MVLLSLSPILLPSTVITSPGFRLIANASLNFASLSSRFFTRTFILSSCTLIAASAKSLSGCFLRIPIILFLNVFNPVNRLDTPSVTSVCTSSKVLSLRVEDNFFSTA